MPNLTSGGATVSSRNSAGGGGTNHQPAQSPPVKRKRNQPGNPDPDAEVVAFSPKTLMATNRFVCDICNKGFQRDQNLKLHRRGHNLPWKLKQRTNNEVKKKKVYVCPETTCAHHDPSRALGDLTGIKKHYSRKHGEKKWKCEKCSKKYAVQSDWKAHSKICGTREYRCDCGTVFSRRDSFITHRDFCDALAEENSRTIMGTSNSQEQQQRFSNVHPCRVATQPMSWTGLSSSSSNIFPPSFDENTLPPAPAACTDFGGLIHPCEDEHAASSGAPPLHSHHPSLLLQEMMNSLSSAATGFDATPFDDIAFSGVLNAKNKNGSGSGNNHPHESSGGGAHGRGLTRDFLGLKAFSGGDFLNIADVSNSINSSQSQKPWQV
ncbi:Protein indeterminate-domain 12 [Hibiscus syriacus]|uniref:Protein indeterminate-domain 12 n=1 Tax=Hibiscus syriacus TaxID=106335 RepID=A0A6A2YDX4_HIBSY|nr:protein indeterminate-domain 7-like [Hibiscus syriacus]KAE8674149.1 Protein indeterminate-domain 12 [Hibiscus syriacus]